MSKNLKVLYEYLCENHPETSNDIFYGLELVQSTIGDSVVQMKKDMHKAVDDGENYDKISEMLKISKLLLSSIDDYLKDLIEMENQFTDENDDEDNSDVADNEKICLLTDDYTYVKVSSVIIGKQKYYVKNFTKALLVICNYLYEYNKDTFIKMLDTPFVKSHLNPYLSYNNYSNYYKQIGNSNIYMWSNLSNTDKLTFITNMLQFFGISTEDVRLGIRADYNPQKRDVKKKRDVNAPTTSDMKIGALVKSKMKLLEQKNYTFSDEMITALTSKELSKQIIGINVAMLLPYDDKKDISLQGVTSKGVRRYWKDVFYFNGNKYLITSQWYDNNREGFEKWYKGLK